MNFQSELLKIDVGAAPLQNPFLPPAPSSKELKLQHLFSTWFGKAWWM